MQKRQLETLLYSTGGVIALVAVLVALNFLVSAINVRADLTEGNVYTLSPGTKAILSKLEAPVRIRLLLHAGQQRRAGRAEDLRAARRGPARRVQGGRRRQGRSSRSSIPSPIPTPRTRPRSTASKAS